MNKSKYLFSDIGGVLLSNGWDHKSRKLAADVFHFDYEEMNLRHTFIFNTCEIGKISLDHYLDIAVFFEERSFTRKQFKDFMYAQSVELPDMIPFVIGWKKNHHNVKIISINNEPLELNRYRIQKFGLHRVFDGFISSCEVGIRKPDPDIFRLAIGISQTESSESLYFDDRPMMVRGAREAGLDAHIHKSFAETKAVIESWAEK